MNILSLTDDFGDGIIVPFDAIDTIFFEDVLNETPKYGADNWLVSITTNKGMTALRFKTYKAALIAWQVICEKLRNPDTASSSEMYWNAIKKIEENGGITHD